MPSVRVKFGLMSNGTLPSAGGGEHVRARFDLKRFLPSNGSDANVKLTSGSNLVGYYFGGFDVLEDRRMLVATIRRNDNSSLASALDHQYKPRFELNPNDAYTLPEVDRSNNFGVVDDVRVEFLTSQKCSCP